MKYSNMPTHKEIKEFAENIKAQIGYRILDEAPESRVVLLSRLEKAIKLT
jgi:wyosine [tRNA(Phe)-imidazoG37] synthetase (radical SAM superfamily)